MKSFRVVSSAVVVFGCTAAILFACSDDNAVNLAVDGGPEGQDGAPDVKADGNNVPVDANPGTDSGRSDAGETDAGADAAPDGSVDLDTVDGGPEAGSDIRQDYINQISEHMCNAYTRCCYGDSNIPDGGVVDGGGSGKNHFNRDGCVATFQIVGFQGSNYEVADSDLGTLSLNTVQRDACFAAIDALPCLATEAQLRDTRFKCYAAFHGSVTAGGPCNHTLECLDGLWCDKNGDAGAPDAGAGQTTTKKGICLPLRSSGGPCGDVIVSNDPSGDAITAEQACSSRGRGDTGLACMDFNPATGDYIDDRSQWKCGATVANGQHCSLDVTCTNGACDSAQNYTCVPSADEFTSGGCTDFTF